MESVWHSGWAPADRKRAAMGRGGVMMWWGMGRRSLGVLMLLFGLIAVYSPQPAGAQVTSEPTRYKITDLGEFTTTSDLVRLLMTIDTRTLRAAPSALRSTTRFLSGAPRRPSKGSTSNA